MAYVIDGTNLVFIHIPRTGGTTMADWLKTYSSVYFVRDYETAQRSDQDKQKCIEDIRNTVVPPGMPHWEYDRVAKTLPYEFDYFITCRNPFQRFRSWYYKQRSRARSGDRFTGYEWFEPHMLSYFRNDHTSSFYKWADDVIGGELFITAFNQNPMTLQSHFVSKQKKPKYIVKAESSKADYKELAKNLDIRRTPRVRHNVSPNSIEDWRQDFINRPDITQWVIDYYADDFEYFGYSTDIYSYDLNPYTGAFV